MSIASRLITSPTVHVIGKTEFDDKGMQDWIEQRGFEGHEDFIGSPLQAIRDGASTFDERQDRSEVFAELAGRFCYNSFINGRPTEEYIANILEQRHGSVLEHVHYNFAIEGVSRSLSLELIRHRAGFAISQESQRYVDANSVRFVVPPMLLYLWNGDLECKEAQDFLAQNLSAVEAYKATQAYIADSLRAEKEPISKTLIKKRANEAARTHLPNACETRLVWSGNLRALRHVCELRGSEHADLEIGRLAAMMTEIMLEKAPFTFSDFSTHEGRFGVPTVQNTHSKV